jgi:hypothetical protein
VVSSGSICRPPYGNPLPIILVEHVERAEATPAIERVVHEVDCPGVVEHRRGRKRDIGTTTTSPHANGYTFLIGHTLGQIATRTDSSCQTLLTSEPIGRLLRSVLPAMMVFPCRFPANPWYSM